MACSGGRFVPGLLLALSLFFPSPPAALAEARGAAPVENFLLGNGMEVVVIPDHRAPVVTHMVWYKIGSADEPPGKSGIAHFFEHLMFKGTPAHPAGTFSAEVDAIGGNENAATSYDYTYYYQTVSPDALPKMMAFEADRMRNLVLTDQVIGPERDVILEERRMRIESSPDALLSEEVQATLYQNHPYRVPVIGWMQEIEALNRTDAVDFYDRYYAPNNAILVVAGDTDPREVRRLAEETYGKVPRGPNLPPRKRPQEPEQNTSRTVTMSDPRVTLPSVAAYWVVPSYRSAADGEAEALDLLSEILGGGSRSRFFQELVKSGKAAGAGASYDGTALDATGFVVYGVPLDSASLGAVEDGLWREIDRLISDGVDETELMAAKGRYVRAMIFAQDSPSSMADIYGSSLATGETVRDVQEWPARIEAVTAAEVQAAARKYLRRDIAVTAYLLPKAAEASR